MRKRRTREHILGDLGCNFVERQVLLAGYTMETFTKDYGYDGVVVTFDENGELEDGFILLQVKATERIKFSAKNGGFELQVSMKDLRSWSNSAAVVVLALYDFPDHAGYFIDVKNYCETENIDVYKPGETMMVYFSPAHQFTPDTVKHFRNLKNMKS